MLIVGKNKQPILDNLPKHFLFIHDGEFEVSGRPFDHTVHRFNPLKNISYRGARDFISILDAIFPEGENTLTHKNSNFVLLNALSDKSRTLAKLLHPSKDPAEQDAYQKIRTLLLSPVLERVLKPTNFSMKGTIVARLDRKELGDFDAFALGNLLIQQYKGTVVIPDYGFYAAPHHVSLIREGRLIAGVNYLDELPEKLRHLFLLGQTTPSQCTFDDAERLALEAGLMRDRTEFSDFVSKSMR